MIDPVTAMLIAQGLGAGVQYLQGGAEAKKARKAEEALRAKGLPKMETPQEAFDLYEKAKENKYAQLATEQANQRFADVQQAMSGAGYRGLGFLSGAQRSADQSVAAIGQQQMSQELGALENLAGMQAQTARANFGMEGQMYMQDLAGAQAGYQAGRQMQASAIDRALATMPSAMGAYSSESYLNKYGDKIPFGEKGMKTPGEFNHDKNPIDLVKNGVKVGEATGGEYIFNPEQSKKMKELASKGDTPLHKYVSKMLNKFDKESKK